MSRKPAVRAVRKARSSSSKQSKAIAWTCNGLATAAINTRQRLAWIYQGDAPQLQIEINRDGGARWDSLAVVPRRSGGSQNFDWSVTAPSTINARLRVNAIGNEAATDVNDANIRIAPAAIQFIVPSRSSSVRASAMSEVFTVST